MTRNLTCIICPNGCQLEAVMENGSIVSVTGGLCRRGEAWAREEIECPKRNFATTVRVDGGVSETVSVRLSSPIPKSMIMPAMEIIRSAHATAPVRIGDVIIHDILSTGSDVIATCSIEASGE